MTHTTELNRLETEKITTLLKAYSLPAIIGMTIVSLYNIIDSIFIGYGVGPMAISGLAVAFPLMNLQLAVCLLVAVGGATICSIELGRKNNEGASQVLGNVLILSLIFGFSLMILGFLLLTPVLDLFGASEATLPYAHDFMSIILYGTPVACVMFGFSQVTRASGYPKKSMMISMLSVGVNLVVAPIFIFVFHWGVKGAAGATVFAQSVSLLAFIFHFRNKKHAVHFKSGIYRLRRSVVSAILKVGISPFSMNVCSCLIVIVINLSLEHYGGDLAIGAYGIIMRLMMLLFMIIIGLTQGMQPILGYNFGAKRLDRVHQTLRYGIIIATIVTTVGFLAVEIFPHALARMFTTDTALIELVVEGLRISAILFFLAGSQIVIAIYFQSVGRSGVAIFLSLSRQLVFLLPGLLLLPLYFGLNGVWLSMPIADFTSFIVTVVILRMSVRSIEK